MEVFHREALAADMAEKILVVAPTSAAGLGLFLAAHRRTGMSTFLREDLRPQLEKRGALVVYVDLWEDRKAGLVSVIAKAVHAELVAHEGAIKRPAREAGKEKLAGDGVTFSVDQIGQGDGISLTAALSALSDETGRIIVLVIEDAQHAITSDKGSDALFALKAARDELNSSRHKGLRVVATGSNRDKLAMLRSSREQAFFGAPLVSFPPLGEDYVQWFCERVGLPAALDPAATFELFKRASFRPELLGAAADSLRFDFGLAAPDVPARFAEAVEEQILASHAEMMRVIHSLTPLQSAVLRVMAKRMGAYAPFEAATIEAYQAVLKASDPAVELKADVPSVQQALTALQEKALVWRAARGVYALEEASLADLMAQEGLLAQVP